MNISSSLVKELRERTGTGIMECKQALIKAQGNIELAIDNLRKLGQAQAAKKTGRITMAGIILLKITQDRKYGVIIELNCETDFVANNKNFLLFGQYIINTALNKSINDINQLQHQVEEERTRLVANIGENINIRRMGKITGDVLNSYVHGTRIGVIIAGTGIENELGKNLAMHIAACQPEYIQASDIPENVINRESNIQLDLALQSGKPMEIAKKIVAGRMLKFTNNITLLNQMFIKDTNYSVASILAKQQAKVDKFIRFSVGESCSINS